LSRIASVRGFSLSSLKNRQNDTIRTELRIHQETVDAESAHVSMLDDLERRQDDVLLQLDDLDKKLTSLLKGLGVVVTEDDRGAGEGLRVMTSDDDEQKVRRVA